MQLEENNMERELLHNSIQCPDGTILVSRSRHNFVEHEQEDGRRYFCDGGNSYSRIGYSDEEFIDLCVYSDDDHTKIREVFDWGSYGINGDEPLKYILLKDITEGHLDALIDYCKTGYPSKILKVFKDEKEYRNNN